MNNPLAKFQLLSLKKQLQQHCIDRCVPDFTYYKLNAQEETCLKNCNSKLNGYKKLAKDLGLAIPVK